MEKTFYSDNGAAPPPKRKRLRLKAACLTAIVLIGLSHWHLPWWKQHKCHHHHNTRTSPYGSFPKSDDPFLFLPCTNATLPPALDDANPQRSWSQLFDPNPQHWNWGNKLDEAASEHDHYDGRGIYLCGYLDVPLDYTNKSDSRIARLAVTKFQVSGLALIDGSSRPSAGHKSERTIVIEPGGPGGSGTSMAWRASEDVTKRLSDSKFDVLGWDPRGVNASLPAISCYPFDADRDHWSLIAGQYREVANSPRGQLELADTMNTAIFSACLKIHGDLPRFVGTAFVARDVEEIRKAIGEDDLTGYFVSYGTGIGQTYANMFPSSVGRLILDGTEYQRDARILGGFGLAALDNATDAWHDGFLGECVNAGPDHCALAKPIDGKPITLPSLDVRMDKLVKSLVERPLAGYTEFSGPSLVSYSALVGAIYGAMYNARAWPALAQMLYELESGNTTLASIMLEHSAWEYDPTLPAIPDRKPSSDELTSLVICADGYDAPLPEDGLDWWESLWTNMTAKSWISGNSRFFNVLPCQRFTEFWPEPAEVYRGDLNKTLKNPILLIAETYDPATPLRNGRRLLNEMGQNARLIAHHGYGHSSRDSSTCTDTIAKSFILTGNLPDEQETACYANEKPYLYGVGKGKSVIAEDPLRVWSEHLMELATMNPQLLP
ncbi:Serine protease Hip1-like protein [Cladobotryum mycophilum]|uniref:Serine protease Hip1-like protein n=1 Tax=Cladobotryum mycophilum TaxID=491253 RepID=A0ABR0SKA3_9HYPO